MHDLLAVYVDGETKTGKGAAGKAIAQSLKNHGLRVYYDVAGDFYRRYVAWVRLDLGLSDAEPLPTGPGLEQVAAKLYESGQAFKRDDALLGDLQRPAIGESVSVLGELPLVQHAGIEWWAKTLQLAQEENAEVVVLDGRNPRLKVQEAQAKVHIPVHVALDLFMTCDPEVAGLRTLVSRGIQQPSDEQVRAAKDEVVLRRKRDRNRPVHPFIVPSESVSYDLSHMSAQEVIDESWKAVSGKDLPVAIKLDNSHLVMGDMLAAVSELALEAVNYVKNR